MGRLTDVGYLRDVELNAAIPVLNSIWWDRLRTEWRGARRYLANFAELPQLLVVLLVLLEGNDPEFSPLLADARVTKPTLKTVIQTIGCNQDELSTDLLKCVDLVISSDMSQETVLGKMRSIL